MAWKVSLQVEGWKYRKPNKSQAGEMDTAAHAGRIHSQVTDGREASSSGSQEHSLPEASSGVAACHLLRARFLLLPLGLLSGIQAASAFAKLLPLLEPAGPSSSLTMGDGGAHHGL